MSSTATGAHEEPRGRSRLRLTLRTAVVLTAVVLLALALAVPVRLYLTQQDQLRQLEQETAGLAELNGDLTIELERLADPAYLEELARACLGMVREGETSFAVVPRDGVPEPVPCTPTG